MEDYLPIFFFCIFSDIAEILGHKDTKVISDSNLALLVRQIAVHCNVSVLISEPSFSKVSLALGAC